MYMSYTWCIYIYINICISGANATSCVVMICYGIGTPRQFHIIPPAAFRPNRRCGRGGGYWCRQRPPHSPVGRIFMDITI